MTSLRTSSIGERERLGAKTHGQLVEQCAASVRGEYSKERLLRLTPGTSGAILRTMTPHEAIAKLEAEQGFFP